MLIVGCPQPIVVIARRPWHAALDNSIAIAVAARAVTGRAENAESLPAAVKQRRRYWRLGRLLPFV
jgi:hypothetical protein